MALQLKADFSSIVQVLNNVSRGGFSQAGAAVYAATAINCIIYNNTSYAFAISNYSSDTISYSDTMPLPAGTGNIAVDPKLLPDGLHLATGSPCIGAGTNAVVFGNDIDGRPWGNPPSIGCSEWVPQPVIVPQISLQAIAPGKLSVSVPATGQFPLTGIWTLNGVPLLDGPFFANSSTTNLIVSLDPQSAGTYQVVVSNAFGMATSSVAQIVVRCVDVNCANPVSPFTSWATAANTIQDAIDAADPGDFIVVTNGVYATGGRSVDGVITNRVTIDKPVTITSVHGSASTIIEGMFDPSGAGLPPLYVADGPLAVRCAWVGGGAKLMGFTLRNGATRSSGAPATATSGGGVYGATSAMVINCILTNNNAVTGAGIFSGTLMNSYVTGNVAELQGGGAQSCGVINCTVSQNYLRWFGSPSSSFGAGLFNCSAYNCIVIGNWDDYPFGFGLDNYNAASTLNYCCTQPLPTGAGNINSATFAPVFVDNFHLSATSPGRGVGSALYVSGTDMDGETWTSTPSMGCDEVIDSDLVGALSVSIQTPLGTNSVAAHGLTFNGIVNGHASAVRWSFDSGPTNANWTTYTTWTNPGTYNAYFTAYNGDNPNGVSTSVTVNILPIVQPTIQSALVSNVLQFNIQTQPRMLYSLLMATNLNPPVFWRSVYSTFGTGDVQQLSDTITPVPPAKFYRIQAQ